MTGQPMDLGQFRSVFSSCNQLSEEPIHVQNTNNYSLLCNRTSRFRKRRTARLCDYGFAAVWRDGPLDRNFLTDWLDSGDDPIPGAGSKRVVADDVFRWGPRRD